MHVGWIGLGRVGMQMALVTLAAGHEVTGHSRSFDRHAEVEAAGGKLCASATETVRDADIVCVNVFSEQQLRDAVIDSGALAAMPAGAVLAIHSTVPPSLIAELASLRPDIDVVDAGFSGIPADARAGTLILMVGGTADAVHRAEPVFSCYADTIFHLGPTGAGMTLKIVNNLLYAAHVSLGREAIGLAVQNGISVHDALAALRRGSAESFALGVYQEGDDPDTVFDRSRPYLEKDVAIGLDAFPGLVDIRGATTRFTA